MTNYWIEHVKQYAKENGISYKEALIESKQSYTGGSIKSNYIAKLIATKNDKFDIKRIKNPSNYLQTRYNKVVEKVVDNEEEEEYDEETEYKKMYEGIAKARTQKQQQEPISKERLKYIDDLKTQRDKLYDEIEQTKTELYHYGKKTKKRELVNKRIDALYEQLHQTTDKLKEDLKQNGYNGIKDVEKLISIARKYWDTDLFMNRLMLDNLQRDSPGSYNWQNITKEHIKARENEIKKRFQPEFDALKRKIGVNDMRQLISHMFLIYPDRMQ